MVPTQVCQPRNTATVESDTATATRPKPSYLFGSFEFANFETGLGILVRLCIGCIVYIVCERYKTILRVRYSLYNNTHLYGSGEPNTNFDGQAKRGLNVVGIKMFFDRHLPCEFLVSATLESVEVRLLVRPLRWCQTWVTITIFLLTSLYILYIP